MVGCKVKTNQHGFLAFRLFWNKQRSWEGTGLRDTPENRKLVEAQAVLIGREIKNGTFNYLKWFPEGNKAEIFKPRQEISTVQDYYDVWIERKVPPFVRKSLARDYRQHFGSYILPKFGSDNLADVMPRRLLEFRTYLLKEVDLSLKTCRNIIDGSFRAMMRDARTVDHLISDDPFGAIQWPTKEVPEPDPFTEQERDEILKYFRTKITFYYPFVYTLFWTGMRPSETTALRVGDVDLRRETASITKSRHIGEENAPKTKGSRRAIRLLPTVVELMRLTKQLRVTERDYVFTNTEGSPINADQWRKDYWYRALRALGIRERKFYTTRHTYISVALTAGANIKWIAQQCGTSVAMIERHYGKYIRDDGDAPLRALLGAESATLGETFSTPNSQPTAFARDLMASPTGFEPVLSA